MPPLCSRVLRESLLTVRDRSGPQAIPLFVTSLAVPFLVVVLRVLRSSDGEDKRLSANDATKCVLPLPAPR